MIPFFFSFLRGWRRVGETFSARKHPSLQAHTHLQGIQSDTGSVSGLINLPTDLGYYLRFAVQKINLNTSEYKKCLLKELI